VLGRTVTRVWPDRPEIAAELARPRDDLVAEVPGGGGEFGQAEGPFEHYTRRVVREGDRLVERTSYRLRIPWFGWVFALPVHWFLGRRRHPPPAGAPARPPWWAPPDRITSRQAMVLGLT